MKEMYDPMTGELIETDEQKTDKEPEMRFDPMTGEPIRQEEAKAEPEMCFDPMTGEPIRQEEAKAEPEVRFDPMTGQPIYGTEGTAPKKKKSKLPVIGAVLAAVVLIAGVLAGCILNGVFLCKADKVLLATKNTLSDQPQFLKDLNLDEATDILASEKYTLEMQMNADEGKIEGAYVSTKNEKQVNVDLNIKNAPSVEVSAALTDSKLKVYVPELSSDLYVLNYKEPADGFLMELLKDNGVTYEQISDALSALYEPKKQESNVKGLAKDIHKQIKKLEWEKDDSKKYKINGKSRKTKGYRVTVTGDDVEAFVDILVDYLQDNYEDIRELRQLTNEMYAEIRRMPDVECTFYIYKNRLAAICMDLGALGECELLFKGGEFRMQNMEFVVSSRYESVSIELIGKTKGSKESYELVGDGETAFSFSYDKKSGKYELILGDSYDADDIISGKISQERNAIGGTVDIGNEMEMQILLKKDAKLKSMPDEREIDILDMSEQDWMSLIYGGLSF